MRSLAEGDDEVFTGDVSLDEVSLFLVPYFMYLRDFLMPMATKKWLIVLLVRLVCVSFNRY